MIEYLLAVQICNATDALCHWERFGKYPSEERCVMNGLSIDPAVVRFKCVMLEKSTIPVPPHDPRRDRP
jgi:hypothetical protein